MAVLRFGISKTDHEWGTLEQLIKDKRNGSPAPKGSGISKFIHNEVNKLYKGQKTNCPGERAVRTRKEFAINVDDAIAEQVECEASQLGISVGELIAKKIVESHLYPPSKP